jgi:hypothetical protein
MARPSSSDELSAGSSAHRWSPTWRAECENNAPTPSQQRRRRGHGVHARALGRPSRAFLTTSAFVSRTMPPRSRRTARRRHVQPRRHGKDERRGSTGLAGRSARSDRGASLPEPRSASALELEAERDKTHRLTAPTCGSPRSGSVSASTKTGGPRRARISGNLWCVGRCAATTSPAATRRCFRKFVVPNRGGKRQLGRYPNVSAYSPSGSWAAQLVEALVR